MPETTEAYDFRGRTLVDREGEKVGKIDELYYDRRRWAARRGRWSTPACSGRGRRFVPIQSASPAGRGPASPGHQRPGQGRSPDRQPMQELSANSRSVDCSTTTTSPTPTDGSTTTWSAGLGGSTTDRRGGRRQPGNGHDASRSDSDEAMTRSEEELHVGTDATRERPGATAQVRGHRGGPDARCRSAVRRFASSASRSPTTTATGRRPTQTSPRPSTRSCSHEEQPVVEKRAVPKERVSLGTETHEDQRQVSEDVRKEQIEVDDQHGTPRLTTSDALGTGGALPRFRKSRRSNG